MYAFTYHAPKTVRQAASLLATELANITGRSLTQDPAWVLLQGDVNLLFGALREQVSARRLSRH